MPAAERPLPAQIGPYRILRRLGAGGMAEVLLGQRFGAGGFVREVAIKVLRPERRGDPEYERLFIAEARLGARFDHPGLVAVHDFGLDGDVYYLCMDRVDGPDLATLSARRPLPRPLALFVAEAIADALAHVHALCDEAGRPLGIIHRDVSPHNVLCSRAGAVKLADFGIAKATAADDRTWGRLRKGKYAYMAPEQLLGGTLGPTCDQFGFGVLLHELLLGRRPFDGDGPLSTMEAIRRAVLAGDHDFGDLRPGLVAVLRRALAPRADDRFPTTADLARAITACRREEAIAGALGLAAHVAAAVAPGTEGDAAAPPPTLAMTTEAREG
ncbi:MAG: serine/threonine-protein kinase [Nannocystaceae bacterium]